MNRKQQNLAETSPQNVKRQTILRATQPDSAIFLWFGCKHWIRLSYWRTKLMPPRLILG